MLMNIGQCCLLIIGKSAMSGRNNAQHLRIDGIRASVARDPWGDQYDQYSVQPSNRKSFAMLISRPDELLGR